MNKLYIYILLVAGLASCDNPWDEHGRLPDDLNNNLYQLVSADPDLSSFAEMMRASGVDADIEANKSYTIWAPTNNSLQQLPDSIRNSNAAMRRFVGNHIGYLENFTQDASEAVRVKMINGKVNTFHKTTFTSSEKTVNISQKDRLAKNGVLHKVDGFLIPRKNVWENMMEETANPVSQLIRNMIDTDSITGVRTNYFQTDVVDLSNEDSLYTFVMLTDEAFARFKEELQPYYKDTLPEGQVLRAFTKGLTKDLVSKRVNYNQVPASLLSIDSVEIYFNPENIVRTINSSNGIIYLMNDFEYKLTDKIPEILIEGEHYNALSGSSTFVSIRPRSWASNGRDVLARGHATASFHITYHVPQAHSTKYKIYWRAVNDNYIPRNNEQRLAINRIENRTFPYIWVERGTFEEVYIGEHEVDVHGKLSLLVTSASVTNNDWNTIVLDYIRLEPVFE